MNTPMIMGNQGNGKALLKALEAEGITDTFIVEQLKIIINEAITQNNKGDRITDYPTILKALQTILKIKDKNFGNNNNINLNFFNPPNTKDLEF